MLPYKFTVESELCCSVTIVKTCGAGLKSKFEEIDGVRIVFERQDLEDRCFVIHITERAESEDIARIGEEIEALCKERTK